MNRCLRAVLRRFVAGACASAVLAAVLAVPALAQINTPQMKASEVAPCRPNMPQRMVSLPGMFMVHVVCDHVLFEIPIKMLDRDMLVNTEFAALSTGSDYVAPGSVVDSRVVRWVRRGNKVYLEDVRYEMWAPNMPNLQRGVEQASLRPVIRAFDAVAEGADGAPIIDVTGLFATDVPDGFGQQFKRHFRMTGVDPKRSYIERVKAFPRNIEIRFYQTWVPDTKELLKSTEDDPIPPGLGFIFHTSMLLLPDKPMTGRYYDERVGYFATPFDDYGTKEHSKVRRAFINRYRLEKKDPAATVSEVVKPIVFYLSHEVPDKWRPYLKRAVEDWQLAFEKAGLKNAIVARDAPTPEEDPDWDPEDVRYNVIRWTPSGRQNAMGPAVVDPRSGEVISSHAIFWHDVLRLAETWYFTQVGPLDPRAQKLPLPDDLVGELLRYVATHEVGHALGLRHNFKAHSAYTVQQLRNPEWTNKWGTSASIMSYARFNYVAQPGDNAGLLPKFGPYDYFAIEWGYRTFGDGMTCDDEWPELDRMAARQIEDPMLRFGGEDAAAPLDPAVNTQVLGSDPMQAAELGLKNVDRVMGMLIPATTQRGQDYSRLAEMYQALLVKRNNELAAVAKLVGGVEEMRYQGGRGTVPYSPVPPERQRQAVKFLMDKAFTKPRALIDPEVIMRIAPTGGTDPLQGSNVRLLSQLLRPGVFNRMAEAKALSPGKPAYVGIDLLKDINDGLFSELKDGQPHIDFYRRTLQRNYVTLLLVASGSVDDPQYASSNIDDDHADGGSMRVKRSVGASRDIESRELAYLSSPLADTAQQYKAAKGRPSEFRAALRRGVGDLIGKIEAAMAKVKDPDTAAHLRDVRAELERAP
jgi:Met-zincin/Domain of unknown function (DUF5117)/Domain of unknown function (DUF5118)